MEWMEMLRSFTEWLLTLPESQTFQTVGLLVVLYSIAGLEKAQKRAEEKLDRILEKERREPQGDFQGRLRRAYAAGAKEARATIDGNGFRVNDSETDERDRRRDGE